MSKTKLYCSFLLLSCLKLTTSIASEEVVSTNFSGFNPNYVLLGFDSIRDGLEHRRQNIDIKFQISFASRIRAPIPLKEGTIITNTVSGLLKFTGPLFFGYTQESYWDIGRDSLPFRESNYRPEFFFKNSSTVKGKLIETYFGYIHESNGRDGEASRGWDRLFIRANFSLGKRLEGLINTSIRNKTYFDLKVWYPFQTGSKNEDITHYAGYLQGSLHYLVNSKTRVGLTARRGTKGGLAQIDATYRPNGKDFQYYMQITSGHGASINRYNRHESSFRMGFIFFDYTAPH